MNVSGLARVTGNPASRPVASAARDRSRLKRAPTRSASRSATMNPALCRLAAYSGPGLPSPAISQRSSAMRYFPLAAGAPLRLAHTVFPARLSAVTGSRRPDQDELLVQQAVRDDVSGHRNRDVDRDLLALPDHDQVDVLHVALDRVPLNRLRQRELAAAGHALQPDQHVRRAQCEQHVVAGQANVPRVGPVAVQDGGNSARAPRAAGRALAELGAGLRGYTYLGHGESPQQQPGGYSP